MKAILWIGPLAGLLGTIAVACSSSPPPPPDATIAQFCSDWGSAYCQPSLCQFDVASCVTYQTGVCNQFAAQATSSGNRVYSQPVGKACIDAINTTFAPTAQTVTAAALNTLSATCNAAFVGSQAAGASCSGNFDCQSGLICGTAPQAAQCGPATAKTLGEACGDPGDTCAVNTACTSTSNGPTCTAAPGVGSLCTTSAECGNGNFCDDGICATDLSQGMACAPTAACTGNPVFCAGNCNVGTGAPALLCDVYPPAQCVSELSFARGSADCNGIAGLNLPVTVADAGVTTPIDSGSSTGDGATGDSSTGAADAAAE
jgi:hypothetical protein